MVELTLTLALTLTLTLTLTQAQFQYAISSDATNVDEIQDFLQESIKGNCEGLMVKTLDTDATYEPSRRSFNWLKVKKDYLAGMGDSCDLVPIGGFWGKGKRTGVYGAYLLACYNEVDEEYQCICKIGTGFSDEALQELTKSLDEHRIAQPRKYYRLPEGGNLTPDVWFEPKQVTRTLTLTRTRTRTLTRTRTRTGTRTRTLTLTLRWPPCPRTGGPKPNPSYP